MYNCNQTGGTPKIAGKEPMDMTDNEETPRKKRKDSTDRNERRPSRFTACRSCKSRFTFANTWDYASPYCDACHLVNVEKEQTRFRPAGLPVKCMRCKTTVLDAKTRAHSKARICKDCWARCKSCGKRVPVYKDTIPEHRRSKKTGKTHFVRCYALCDDCKLIDRAMSLGIPVEQARKQTAAKAAYGSKERVAEVQIDENGKKIVVKSTPERTCGRCGDKITHKDMIVQASARRKRSTPRLCEKCKTTCARCKKPRDGSSETYCRACSNTAVKASRDMYRELVSRQGRRAARGVGVEAAREIGDLRLVNQEPDAPKEVAKPLPMWYDDI